MTKKEHENIHAYTMFLVGLVFLVESVFFIFVLEQLSPLLGSIAAVGWAYAIIKFVAGLLAIYTGLAAVQKK